MWLVILLLFLLMTVVIILLRLVVLLFLLLVVIWRCCCRHSKDELVSGLLSLLFWVGDGLFHGASDGRREVIFVVVHDSFFFVTFLKQLKYILNILSDTSLFVHICIGIYVVTYYCMYTWSKFSNGKLHHSWDIYIFIHCQYISCVKECRIPKQ